MALTAQNLVDIRYYCGFSVSGDSTSFPYRELAYSDVSYMGLSLDYRLAHLSPEEESRVTTYFLPAIAAREADIQTAAQFLGTTKAAVWTRNDNEIANRTSMFNALRTELCRFLGFAPGPGLGSSNRLVRG
jgi:hypothetical protein